MNFSAFCVDIATTVIAILVEVAKFGDYWMKGTVRWSLWLFLAHIFVSASRVTDGGQSHGEAGEPVSPLGS